jgi:hypothetical protein
VESKKKPRRRNLTGRRKNKRLLKRRKLARERRVP